MSPASGDIAPPAPSDLAFPPGRWRARWIWCEAPRIALGSLATPVLAADAPPRTALFRRTLALDAAPAGPVPARIVSDSRHVLRVNGEAVARGPIRGNPRRLHHDVVDLAAHLRPGRNVVAVVVRFYRHPTPWWMPSVPSFSLGAGSLAFEARLPGGGWLASDASWRTLACDAWSPLAGHGISAAPLEWLDARLLPAGWDRPDFDDAAWAPAVELDARHVGTTGDPHPPSHPFGPLPPRPIPQLGGALSEARPVALSRVAGGEASDDPVRQVEADARSAPRAGGDATVAPPAALPLTIAGGDGGVTLVTLDFGEQVAGTVQLELEAPAGTRLDASAAESLDGEGRLHRLQQHSGFRYVARGADDRFESLDPLGLRFLQLALRHAAGPVTLRAARVQERLCPRPPGASFACSDAGLTRIWEIGRRTVDLCSHDAYLDCPSREQRAWTGDSVVHQMVDLATNPDLRLARRHLELTASPRADGMLPMAVGGDIEASDATYIPDWPLHWVRALHNLMRYTGDTELVATMLPVAEGLLRWFVPFQGADGLLADVTGWVLIDWSAVGVEGKAAALNALWARALADFAELAEWQGDAGRAGWARATWARVRDGFEIFWDERRGLYVDHVVRGERRRAASQHASAAAICAGLVPAERLGRALSVLVERERLVRASWLLPGRTSPPEDGDMYGGAASLVMGPAEPWWDVERQVVAAQPFFRYVVHDAVARAGRADLVADLCRDWQELVARCPTSWSETWFGGSRCHGWSATPTRDLIVYTLGVTPHEPGFGVARVAPRLGDLAWARGKVPTPFGWIQVEATADAVEVESPVPVELVPERGEVRRLEAGRHAVALG